MTYQAPGFTGEVSPPIAELDPAQLVPIDNCGSPERLKTLFGIFRLGQHEGLERPTAPMAATIPKEHTRRIFIDTSTDT